MNRSIPLWTKAFFARRGLSLAFSPLVKSSNDWAKAQVFQGPARGFPRAFLAVRQSAGRGQNDKTWTDSDLMLSLLWEGNLRKITENSASWFARDLLTALKEVWPKLPLNVKAPNDLLLDGKKTAGLLLEPVRQGQKTALIAGLGLNVWSAPKQLKAVCLAEYTDGITFQTWEVFLSGLLRLWSQRALKPEAVCV